MFQQEVLPCVGDVIALHRELVREVQKSRRKLGRNRQTEIHEDSGREERENAAEYNFLFSEAGVDSREMTYVS